MAKEKKERSISQRAVPARRVLIKKVLNQYDEPVLLSDFVKNHVTELGLTDDQRGRHTATVYVNRMVTMGELAKEKKGRYPYIYVPEDKLKEIENISDDMFNSAPLLNPDERRNEIIRILKTYKKKALLANFITDHITDLGYEKNTKNLATLRAFIYRMADKKLIQLKKEKKSLYLDLMEHDKGDDIPDTKPLVAAEHIEKTVAPVELVQKKTEIMPEKTYQKQETMSLPLTFETLVEAKHKLIEQMEQLDLQLEEIVEKKKELKLKRDELLNKIKDLF